MSAPLYAVVAYMRNPLGRFVENLHHELHPDHSGLPGHFTILPPRLLQGSEAAAREILENVCRDVQPFEVTMGDVETFAPITPTVFIRVAHAAYRMRELHDRLNSGALEYNEPWPYMPHLTIIKHDNLEQAWRSTEVARQRWAEYRGARRVRLDELTFVREGEASGSWIDLAPIPLGSHLALKH